MGGVDEVVGGPRLVSEPDRLVGGVVEHDIHDGEDRVLLA